jgi:drug/metabolite transporter (DMT)-like permease
MNRRFLAGFLVLLAFDTLGQLGFKLVADRVGAGRLDPAWVSALLHTPALILVAVAYGGAFFAYMGLMRSADVGPLFAATHLDLVTVTLLSVAWFGERMNPGQLVGFLGILGGVIMLGAEDSRIHGRGRSGEGPPSG